jgi:hypothetical protein
MSDEQGIAAPEVTAPTPDAPSAPPVETGTTETVAEQPAAEQPDDERKPDDSHRRLRGVEKRINELTGTIHNERREKQQLVDIIKAFTGKSEAPAPQQQGAPTWAEYQAKGLPYEDYVAAKAEFAATRRFEELNQRQTQATTRTQQETQQRELGRQLAANHERSVSEFVKTHPDYAEVVDRDDIEIPNTAGALIQADSDSAAIFYAIAKEPRLAQQLRQYDGNVVMQARVIGAIAAKLQATPQISKAPPAGKTVGAKGGSSNDPPADTAAYMEWRKKNLR